MTQVFLWSDLTTPVSIVTSLPSQIWQLCWQGSDALYLVGPGQSSSSTTLSSQKQKLYEAIYHFPSIYIIFRRTTARKKTARCLTGEALYSGKRRMTSSSPELNCFWKQMNIHCASIQFFLQILLSVFVNFAKCISWEDSGCTLWPNKACKQSLSPRELQILQSEVEPNTAQIIPLMSPTSKQTKRFSFGTKMQLTQFCWKCTILRKGRWKCNSYKPVPTQGKHFAYHSSRSLAPL